MKTFGFLVLVGVLSCGGVLATSALAQRVGSSGAPHGGLRERIAQHLHGRGQKLREIARALELTPAQQQQALDIAHAAEPLARDVRKEIARALVSSPQTGARDAQRSHVKQLAQNSFLQLEPQVRALVSSLTPAQRQRLDALARKHGRTLDDDRLVKRLAWLLSRPMAAPLFEARLGR